ncbi:hypothetical protein D9757_011443 [Collybiopsis confluens]|uniref:Uncharacterized protein n=1 Tax=Collybiopsis confluens TaxID=2823264 RepID=A0A8H5LPV7_9AGAR|nr:hypothetical protein D9757_013560 [Collybiopsis confluens]KAF5365016.1 hypothetical protein D9757_011443 [Collybiopsis confluens]
MTHHYLIDHDVVGGACLATTCFFLPEELRSTAAATSPPSTNITLLPSGGESGGGCRMMADATEEFELDEPGDGNGEEQRSLVQCYPWCPAASYISQLQFFLRHESISFCHDTLPTLAACHLYRDSQWPLLDCILAYYQGYPKMPTCLTAESSVLANEVERIDFERRINLAKLAVGFVMQSLIPGSLYLLIRSPGSTKVCRWPSCNAGKARE